MSSPQATPSGDFSDAMVAADVLETFNRLPLNAQEEFLDWITRANDEDAHWRRIDALVLAMRSGVLHTPVTSVGNGSAP